MMNNISDNYDEKWTHSGPPFERCEIEDKYGIGETEYQLKSRQCRQGWRNTLLDFAENTTLHGFRFIWMSDTFRLRRLIWLLLMLVGTGIMCFQVIDRIMFYYDWPVNVNVEINFNKSLSFPAVTICNQNAFRATAAAADGRYRLIESLYSGSGTNPSMHRAENVSLDDLFLDAAHHREDLIVQCTWDGRQCTADNFTMVMTDHGICYSFHDDKSVNSPGADNGLQLTVNIEQYEYMPGPHGAAGLKIFMHDIKDTPLVGELGFAIPVGSHSFVGNSLRVIKNLPPPYGECGEQDLEYFDLYTSANCKLNCLTKYLDIKCGCRDSYMPDIKGYPPVCTLHQKYNCMLPALETYQQESEGVCEYCSVACLYKVYQPTISYASISNFVIDKLLANINSQKLGQKFMAAKEITHRMEDNKFKKFQRLVDDVQLKFDRVRNLFVVDISEKIEYQCTRIVEQERATLAVWERKNYINRYQDFMMQKNYLRGRDAMEERTLGQIANGFQEFVLNTEAKLRDLVHISSENTTVRYILYQLLKHDLTIEAEMIRRGQSNLTMLIDSFKNADAIFGYKFGKNPRSTHASIVPHLLLDYALTRNSSGKGKRDRILSDLMVSLEYIEKYNKLVDTAYINHTLNATELQIINAKFSRYSRRYFGNKANLYFESIDWAADQIRKRMEDFMEMRDDIVYAFNDMRNNINSLNSSLWNVKDTILENLSHGCSMAQSYLKNDSISKLDVSYALTSPDIHEGINTMKVYLQEVRSRGQNLYDDWSRLINLISAMWVKILDDGDAKNYYKHTNITDFLQDKGEVTSRVTETIASIRDSGDLRDIIQNRGRIFLKSLYDIMDDAQDFKKTTKLDEAFLRENFVFLDIYYSELSYEQVTQQEGYGLFPLLCDIGGSMGLFIGASVLTIFEIIDLVVNQTFKDLLGLRDSSGGSGTRV